MREGEGEGRGLLGERAGNWGNTLSTAGARQNKNEIKKMDTSVRWRAGLRSFALQ